MKILFHSRRGGPDGSVISITTRCGQNDRSLLMYVELVAVRFPPFLHVGHDPLILGIAAQAVIGLVFLKPRIAQVSQFHPAPEKRHRVLMVTEQSIDSSGPICLVSIDDLLRASLKNSLIDLVPLVARRIQKRGHDSR